MKETIKRIRDNGVPLDVVHADLPYMDNFRDFTISPEKDWPQLPAYVEELHKDGLHFIPITDPGIEVTTDAFRRALDSDAKFVEWPTEEMVPKKVQKKYPLAKGTKIMLAVVWPSNHSAFPDFFNQSTIYWWERAFVQFHKKLSFDGVWIDMNEPAILVTNEHYPVYEDDHPAQLPLMCPIREGEKGSYWDHPPFETSNVYLYGLKKDYMVTNALSTDSLCMIASTQEGRFYDVKNLYGWAESVATQPAVQKATGKRGLVVSRSTFPSSGRYAGHWLGDNRATWQDLEVSVNGVLDFNMFGIPYVRADVCGFNEPASQELCLRWHQLGAFHSLYRNHNADSSPPQDPSRPGWEHVLKATKMANLWRYRHLPYLYTLHFEASSVGGTVIRPAFFEFPNDPPQKDPMHAHFMWGEAILVVPVLVPESEAELDEGGLQQQRVHLPEDAVWYSLRDHRYGERMSCKNCCEPATRHMMIPVYVRGGYIIPRQVPSRTITKSRLNEFQLLIALDGNSTTARAHGELYWDDGESIVDEFDTHDYWHFMFDAKVNRNSTSLVITALRTGKDPDLHLPTLGQLEFFGHDAQPNFEAATVNGRELSIVSAGQWNETSKVLNVTESNLLDLNYGGINNTWTITWPNLAAPQE
ncbi:Protein AAGR-2 [Aphelenchoides avenae]|nr:Protein AAGR-2 [Aphelenchus avenae]